MFRLPAAAAFVAGSLGMVAAQTYADFTLDTAVATPFAGTLDSLGTFAGDVDTNRALCDSLPTCVGFICRESIVSNGSMPLYADQKSNI